MKKLTGHSTEDTKAKLRAERVAKRVKAANEEAAIPGSESKSRNADFPIDQSADMGALHNS